MKFVGILYQIFSAAYGEYTRTDKFQLIWVRQFKNSDTRGLFSNIFWYF